MFQKKSHVRCATQDESLKKVALVAQLKESRARSSNDFSQAMCDFHCMNVLEVCNLRKAVHDFRTTICESCTSHANKPR